MPTSVPTVTFTDERLANGLRLIVAEDHLAPVVAVNIWYDVGSKHEQPGKTGFAHLFEHVMFQGSAHVGKAEHIALVQAAGGTMNGTTWLDRTNYFETLPVAPARARAVARGRPDGARSSTRSARRTSTTSARSSRTRSAGPTTTGRTARGTRSSRPTFPARAPVPPPDDRLDGGPRRGLARGRQRVLPDLLRAEQRGPVDRRRRRRRRGPRRAPSATSGASRPTPSIPPLGDLSLPPTLGGERRETVPDRVPLPRVYFGFRAPVFGDPRLDALDIAGQILAGGKGSRLHRRLVRDERIAQDVALFALGFVGGASIVRRLGDRPARRPGRARRGGVPRGARAAGHRAGQPTTSWPARARSSRPTSWARSSGSRSGPTGCRCTRRCSTTRTSSTGCCRATWP